MTEPDTESSNTRADIPTEPPVDLNPHIVELHGGTLDGVFLLGAALVGSTLVIGKDLVRWNYTIRPDRRHADLLEIVGLT